MPMFGIRYTPYHNAVAVPPLPYDQWDIMKTYVFDDFNKAKMVAESQEIETIYAYRNREEYYSADVDMYLYRLRDGQTYETLGINPEYKYVAFKMPDTMDHKTREAARIEADEYTPLPDHMQYYAWCHAGLTEDKQIRFYECERDAMNDRPKSVKPSRYFSYFYNPDQTWDFMAELGLISNDFTLKFANTRKQIRFVYENGPESCMSGEAKRFGNGVIHPTEAYASPDLELAYLVNGDDEEGDDAITSRALCNATTKEWVRIYGDVNRMRKMLEEAGYTENSFCLGGCRLLKIFDQREDGTLIRNRIVMPYLDGNFVEAELVNGQEYLTIISKPMILRGTTDGYVHIDR